MAGLHHTWRCPLSSGQWVAGRFICISSLTHTAQIVWDRKLVKKQGLYTGLATNGTDLDLVPCHLPVWHCSGPLSLSVFFLFRTSGRESHSQAGSATLIPKASLFSETIYLGSLFSQKSSKECQFSALSLISL